MKVDTYELLWEGKAKLRLYLNDPAIPKDIGVPVVIEGEVLFAEKEGKHHLIFKHSNPDFMPVFFDLEDNITISSEIDKEEEK